MVWNTLLCLARWGQPPSPGCAPSWILVKINPVLAEPRASGIGQMLIKKLFPPYFCRMKGNTDYLFAVKEGQLRNKFSH